MTPERWAQVKQLFQQALELDEHSRATFLAKACSGDENLRREVELLMSGHTQATSFIERPPQAFAAEVAGPPRTLRLGQVISHYRINSPLGSGGVGEVYLAEDTRLKRKVAIKVLRRHPLEDEVRSRKRLIREAQAAATLDHPNICAIHEVGEEDNQTFIAMQYVEGETLADMIRRGPLDPVEALAVAAQVADALSEAHSRGITHRDIKPGNIMVTTRGRVKVLDFGLAKVPPIRDATRSDSVTQSQLTDPGTIMGTIAYMSPEQLRGEPVDARTDIFSLGVSLYETLCGHRPFDGTNDLMLMVHIVSGEPRPLGVLRPEVGPELVSIINKALSKSPQGRYQTADEMKRDLLKVISEEHATGRISQAVTAELDRTALAPALRSGWRKISPEAAAVALLTLLILGAIGWLLFWTNGRREPDAPSSYKLAPPLANWKSEPVATASHPTFSRDGRMIAYSASINGGDAGIWTKQVSTGDEGEPVLVDSGNDYSPLWSPDGQQLAFVSGRGGEVGIWSVPAFGGGSATLHKRVDAPNPSLVTLGYWSKDGATIFYALKSNLFALEVSSGKNREVRNFENPSTLTEFSVSPLEDRIAYVDSKDGQIDLWLADLKGGKPVKITDDPWEDRYPVWHPDGKRIIYSSNRSDTYQICVAYLDGRKPNQITFGDTDFFVSDVSADGSKILYTTQRDQSDIWRANVETGEELGVTSETDVQLWPAASPDGHSLAYQSARGISPARFLNSWITTRGIGGARQTKLARGFDPSWSPDGRRIAFLRSSSDTAVNVLTVPATGGEERELTDGAGIFFEGFAPIPCNRLVRNYSWSPDGKFIAYCSPFLGKMAEVWAVSVDSGEKTRLSIDTAEDYFVSPLWSPDSRRIWYLSKSKTPSTERRQITRIWIGELGNTPRSVYETSSFLSLIGWVASSSEILIASGEGTGGFRSRPTNVALGAISADRGVQRPIAVLKSAYLYSIVASPNGKLVAFDSRRDGRDNVWVVRSTGGIAKPVTANTDPRLYCSSLAWSPDSKAIYYGKQARQSLISMIDNFR